MSAADLLALAERCEREEASDELWHALARTLGWRWELDGRITYWFTPEGDIWILPDWLRSLDAAVTLVPEGLTWMVQGNPSVALVRYGNHLLDEKYGSRGDAKTPALALCAAALKARAAIASPQGRANT